MSQPTWPPNNPYLQKSLKRAYAAGNEAVLSGRLRSNANDYPPGTPEREAFNLGFRRGNGGPCIYNRVLLDQ